MGKPEVLHIRSEICRVHNDSEIVEVVVGFYIRSVGGVFVDIE